MPHQPSVTRAIKIPDSLRLERYRRNPELGPAVLFFSGGSALKKLSRQITRYTKNSIHLLTPFDSGGSSAKLREAFNMPAVGDMRSRLMALADHSITGNPEVYALANYRLPMDASPSQLHQFLEQCINGDHELVKAIPNPLRRLIRLQLRFFLDAMPEDFDLRGASVGNLVLTGGYLNYKNHLDPILYLFSKLLAVQGLVRPVTDDNFHLVVELESGERILGQHLFTGKEGGPIDSPIKDLWLSESATEIQSVKAVLPNKVANHIRSAELICYPPGSFYSSLIANLLPEGVGKAIAANECPKIYVPNLGHDPEQLGMTLQTSVEVLLRFLRVGSKEHVPDTAFLNTLLLDVSVAQTLTKELRAHWARQGIQVIETRLINENYPEAYDGKLLTEALLSLT